MYSHKFADLILRVVTEQYGGSNSWRVASSRPVRGHTGPLAQVVEGGQGLVIGEAGLTWC